MIGSRGAQLPLDRPAIARCSVIFCGMDANAVAIGSAIIAAIIAITVPWFTFRLALRQDQQRWLREQRTELYVDVLTEAYAEEHYLQYTTTDPETQQRTEAFFKGPTSDCRRWSVRGSGPVHHFSAAEPSTVCSTRSATWASG